MDEWEGQVGSRIMAEGGARVEFENDRVKVIRVKTGGRTQDAQAARGNRLIVYLHDGHVKRAENDTPEVIRRRAGDVVWRDRSQHQIENLGDAEHEVLIIELKD
jgi:hypothetical protein